MLTLVRYGVVLARHVKVVLDDQELRPWEEKPTFKPQLNETEVSKEIKSKARSSKYGQVIPVKKQRKPEKFKFKPNLNVTEVCQLVLPHTFL